MKKQEPIGHHVIGYADGSAFVGDELGGWAFAVHDKLEVYSEWGHASGVTNNQMELEAAIQCMRYMRRQGFQRRPVLIVCDSQYVTFGANQEREWKRRGWHKVKNPEYWEAFFEQQAQFDCISFAWVKGHAGHFWNEYVDELAGRGREAAKKLNNRRAGNGDR